MLTLQHSRVHTYIITSIIETNADLQQRLQTINGIIINIIHLASNRKLNEDFNAAKRAVADYKEKLDAANDRVAKAER